MHQWKTFPTEHMEGCDDVHSTISRGLLLHPGQHHRKTTIKTLSFRYFSYRAQSFILNYVITVKMSNGWKEEFYDIPWLADEQIQCFVLPFYATSVSGHGQLWRQTSITVKSRSKLARGLEKTSKAACIKSQTKHSTNVNK